MSLSEVQINRDAMAHNLKALRSMVSPGTTVTAVVKGNAYGHGLKEVVGILEPVVDAFQVDDIEELRTLRAGSSKRALVFGYVTCADLEEAISLGAELTVYDSERLPLIAEAGVKLGVVPKVHLKVDALLGRQGVLPDRLETIVAALKRTSGVQLESAYGHFANIEDTTDLGHAQRQMDVFDDCWRRVRDSGWPDLARHVSATSGLLTMDGENDMVRLGVGLYGMYPSESLSRSHSDLGLQPVMRWVSRLAQVKALPGRHPVGYGLTFITPREMRVGIVPQGYADGYDRGLSNSGEVLVRGIRCRVLGRVAMNMFAVDLSDVPGAMPEDEVVLLGGQGNERITAEEIASRLGTINYEITARVSPLLPRVVV